MIHSKVIATLILCLSLLTGILIYTKKDALFAQATKTEDIVRAENSQTTTFSNADWKKQLASFQEANDPIEIITKKDSSDTNTFDDSTLTAQVAKTMFSLYLDAQKNGVEIDENTAAAIADKTLSQINPQLKPKLYDIPDVKVITDSSDPSIKTYETQIIGAIKKNIHQGSESELDVFSKILQSSDEKSVKQLDPYIAGYQGLVRDTLAIRVPQVAIGYHMVYLNTLSSIVYDLQVMKLMVTDPIMGYFGFSNYERDVLKLKVTIDRANVYFSKRKTQ